MDFVRHLRRTASTAMAATLFAAGGSAPFRVFAAPPAGSGPGALGAGRPEIAVGDPVYPPADHLPTVAEITGQLGRIRAYLEGAYPGRIIDRVTGGVVAPDSPPVASAVMDRGEEQRFNPLDYTTAVIHDGMMRAAEATGDRRFADFTDRQLRFIAASIPYFRAQAAAFGMNGNSFRPVFAPAALDDCGAMAAALIKARMSGLGPDLLPVIRVWSEYVGAGQFRLADGTLARHRPQPVSIWADDLYMGAVPLVQMARFGDAARLDDAARDVAQTAQRLYRPARGLFTHGWSEDSPEAPDFYWGRANGWAMVTLCELLDALPENHPLRAGLLDILRGEIRSVASLQSGEGRWHQMLDRDETFLETSASAMFVYGIAHAINRGWVTASSYGAIAQAGWNGVAGQINERGQVCQTCVATTYAADQMYYYHRPVSAYATHGYGPALMAGAEMIRLLRNPAWSVEFKNQTYFYVPRTAPRP